VQRLVIIAIGGVIGALARYAAVVLLGNDDLSAWPWDTLTVNLVGALVIGVLADSSLVKTGPHWVGPFVITGFLGGFTTFSAFALETGTLLDAGRAPVAAAYVLVTMVGGLLAVRLGVLIGRPT